MDERSTPVFTFFLFCLIAGMPAAANIQDVCSSCHVNATCDNKSDNSGKVCNCKYGFVGNGRTLCQDKDECQIGATKICGQHTTCHNTYGSYYCTCLDGYMASNNMPVFIPNDGTHCQDMDECSVSGQCGPGGQCRNLDGGFDCSCQLGYRVHNGKEPFHPHKDKASCKVVDCGHPALQDNMLLFSATGTTYGSVATFVCGEGFLLKSGVTTSLCGDDGLWTRTNMICEVVDCGPPPHFPHSHMLWNKSSKMGAEVFYQCNFGYRHAGDSNVSTCTNAGQWEGASVLCQEILCGKPPTLPNTGYVWNGTSALGSIASYYCKPGFDHSEGSAVSRCMSNGNWTKPDVSCKEVDCGAPPDISNSVRLWDNRSTVGSEVVYLCNFGYYNIGDRTTSVCTDTGIWDQPILHCQEIKCQEPVVITHTKRLWDGATHVGSVVVYQCDEGYDTRSTRNYSVCGESGLWEDIDLWCEAKCGPIPLLAHSDVVWHNNSVVIHRCVNGYHSWRGSDVSLCSSSGVWQMATIKCIEIKPPISHLLVSNEKCLQWRAEKYEEDTEIYKVAYIGSRDYDRANVDKRKQFLSSTADWLEVCLSLLPATNYSISITAMSKGFTASISTNTSLTVPPIPDVYYREYETPAPTLRLHRSPNSLDPISLYQVFVLPIDDTMVFDCSAPVDGDTASKYDTVKGSVQAQMRISHIGTAMNFTVGDGLYYGGFFNAPLEKGRHYYVVLRAVSQWKRDLKSSCVLWAKVTGTSYVVRVSSLCGAATVGLIALAVLLRYTYIWCVKKT
uniref:sushi domain-containing protein 1 isoform X2 n=1 Tax=Doryrhamphus excisus TaxID=161450 RepID=UPI0025ADC579|nr:sushi domain-containing protein 1 isoform X2 [Doryrhamphus excisus]